ncbi:MAG: hypothetical protein F6K55_20110 [Moorea sp. SIO4A3]|nr:hypothetical protein [Moorena sp. SIO4A3]
MPIPFLGTAHPTINDCIQYPYSLLPTPYSLCYDYNVKFSAELTIEVSS